MINLRKAIAIILLYRFRRLAAADASAPFLKMLEDKAQFIELASAAYLSF